MKNRLRGFEGRKQLTVVRWAGQLSAKKQGASGGEHSPRKRECSMEVCCPEASADADNGAPCPVVVDRFLETSCSAAFERGDPISRDNQAVYATSSPLLTAPKQLERSEACRRI